MKEKKKFNFHSRRFIAVFLALALTVCLGMATLTGAGAVSISDFTVRAFFVSDSVGFTSDPLTSGSSRVYRSGSMEAISFGFYILLPASSSSSLLTVSGVFPVSSSSSLTSTGWVTSSSNFIFPATYFFSGSTSVSSSPMLSNGTNALRTNWDNDSVSLYVPSHSSPLYLYFMSTPSGTGISALGYGASYSSGASIILEQSPWISLQTSVNSLLISVNEIKNSIVGGGQQSPMDQFESDYLNNFSNQLDKTEQYLGSGSPVIPDNFVSGSGGQPSMVDSITDNMGFSNSSFDSQKFGDAIGSLSGSSSIGDSGPWQFFTEEVANDMSTGGTSYALRPPDPMEEFEDWISRSEGWLSSW